ncbi:exosortase-associated protein EpsI, B-type [Macromonas nakdongensis]|uniref:exosortase-associated protein EpsI, B-type n=1 Tax=Macromonas nakdongensis TaxID=1843082 RepID=UPI000C330491|nr:exosortase-associated protein EpsI, B-type [Macromonas nakdongensis]
MKRGVVLLVLMCAAALGAYALKPTMLLADQLPPINLEAMVPKAFGDWRAVEQGTLQVINPQAKALVNTLYQDVLNRVYVNQSGYAIMLSIAYGRNQRDGLDVHKPEVCYQTQGFQLNGLSHVNLSFLDRVIPVTRLMTRLGGRFEPVTYWVVLGDQISRGGFEKKFKEIRYAFFMNLIPDGILVRFSSIDSNSDRAYAIQGRFADQLFVAMDPEARNRFAGRLLP